MSDTEVHQGLRSADSDKRLTITVSGERLMVINQPFLISWLPAPSKRAPCSGLCLRKLLTPRPTRACPLSWLRMGKGWWGAGAPLLEGRRRPNSMMNTIHSCKWWSFIKFVKVPSRPDWICKRVVSLDRPKKIFNRYRGRPRAGRELNGEPTLALACALPAP
jgi:hypothetical protein